VVLDDPAVVAQALREQMEPADLMELMFILAEATAGVLRQQKQIDALRCSDAPLSSDGSAVAVAPRLLPLGCFGRAQ
jgi:hypothetical protein